MRARLILGLVTGTLLMVPQAAQAVCVPQPFDQVVRQSDSVLVGTVSDARARAPQTGLIISIDVEEVLKGSPDDGQEVGFSSCGVPIVGPEADAVAQRMIGERQLFLLQKSGSGEVSVFGGMVSPRHMSLNEQIARASDVLGVTPQVVPSPQSAMPTVPALLEGDESDSLSSGWVGVVAVLALVALALFAVRRSRRSPVFRPGP